MIRRLTRSRAEGRRPARRWRQGLRFLRNLLEHPDATENAVALVYALDSDRPRRCLRRLERSAQGRRLLAERPRLLERLTEREWLAALPEGSFGRAYLDHIERHRLDPVKLVELHRRIAPDWEGIPSEERWWSERSALMHDLWHALTGCGADPAGESELLPFSLAQQPGWANLFLTLGVGLRGVSRPAVPGGPERVPVARLGRAWRAGRRARWLGDLPYEELLAKPLAEVRALAGVRALRAPVSPGVPGFGVA